MRAPPLTIEDFFIDGLDGASFYSVLISDSKELEAKGIQGALSCLIILGWEL